VVNLDRNDLVSRKRNQVVSFPVISIQPANADNDLVGCAMLLKYPLSAGQRTDEIKFIELDSVLITKG
jgi:hypothetical protein